MDEFLHEARRADQMQIRDLAAAIERLKAENEQMRAFAFGAAPEWEKANATLKHRVRELEAENERHRIHIENIQVVRHQQAREIERLREAVEYAVRTDADRLREALTELVAALNGNMPTFEPEWWPAMQKAEQTLALNQPSSEEEHRG